MLTPTYSTANRVGFQILAGAGLGSAAAMVMLPLSLLLQAAHLTDAVILIQPFVAVQNLIPHSQIAIAMAILVFSLNFGGATFLTLAETDFSQSLLVAIPKYAPGVDATTVKSLGATDFRSAVSAADLPGVLKAYSVSVDHVFYLVCASAAAAFLSAWGMGWKDIRKHKPNPPGATP